jgi:hypothetical protein
MNKLVLNLEASQAIAKFLEENTTESYFYHALWETNEWIISEKKIIDRTDEIVSRGGNKKAIIVPAFTFSEFITNVLPKITQKKYGLGIWNASIANDCFKDLLRGGGMVGVSRRIIKLLEE